MKANQTLDEIFQYHQHQSSQFASPPINSPCGARAQCAKVQKRKSMKNVAPFSFGSDTKWMQCGRITPIYLINKPHILNNLRYYLRKIEIHFLQMTLKTTLELTIRGLSTTDYSQRTIRGVIIKVISSINKISSNCAITRDQPLFLLQIAYTHFKLLLTRVSMIFHCSFCQAGALKYGRE